MAFKKIRRRELCFNPFDKIGKEWMLLTGGTPDDFNTMTASWGTAWRALEQKGADLLYPSQQVYI